MRLDDIGFTYKCVLVWHVWVGLFFLCRCKDVLMTCPSWSQHTRALTTTPCCRLQLPWRPPPRLLLACYSLDPLLATCVHAWHLHLNSSKWRLELTLRGPKTLKALFPPSLPQPHSPPSRWTSPTTPPRSSASALAMGLAPHRPMVEGFIPIQWEHMYYLYHFLTQTKCLDDICSLVLSLAYECTWQHL